MTAPFVAQAPTNSLTEFLEIRGVRVHNLKNIDIDIPRDQLVVVTGPSGSGKSSLAFDTIHAEGQRQYIETLSVYVRQYLHQMERPDVDSIHGLQPTLCIDQRPGNANPRSTVATVTEIYDYLRVLMARCGEVFCFECGQPIRQQSIEQIQTRLMKLPDRTKTMILAPMVRGRKGAHRDVISTIRKAGFVRVRIDDQIYDVDQVPELNTRKTHTIEAVIDRIVIREGISGRLAESIQSAVTFGDGLAIACYEVAEVAEAGEAGEKSWRDEVFNTLYACPDCSISYEELEPRTFSFNSPYGACPQCEGLGHRDQFDPEVVLPDLSLSIEQSAIAAWRGLTKAAGKKQIEQLQPFLEQNGLDTAASLDQWSAEQREQLLFGSGESYLGVMVALEKEFATSTRQPRLEELESMRDSVTCRHCSGTRLRPEANNVKLCDRTIGEIVGDSVADAIEFFETVSHQHEGSLVVEPLVVEIIKRLRFLRKVGLDYLSLTRAADTLSGGELQRVRLATCIGSGLVGVCYVLDEPSIGLHSRDNERLIECLRELQQNGNTVIVVEHDEAIMRQADHLIDVGPSAGRAGGEIVTQGLYDEVCRDPKSITGQYLSGAKRVELNTSRRQPTKKRSITLEGASLHNLKSVDVDFPLGLLVCVSGVSGSGKSSLVNGILTRAIKKRLGLSAPRAGSFTSLRGVSEIEKLVEIDQRPIGRTPRSNAATYTGVFDEIRKVFANTRQAKQRGYNASRFSFNAKIGRCEACDGHGVKRIEMNFLPDIFVPCETCAGRRFNHQTLQVKFKEKSIADVLEMSVDEAVEFFENVQVIHRVMNGLSEVGLGYLPLGQASTTLSGGEAQRIKLAAELSRVNSGKTLYVLDEPTTGLHFQDIQRLLNVLDQLVEKGNSVIVIEHNLDVIRCADWVVDLGPEGGQKGGQVVAQGTPEEIAACDKSETGKFLRNQLAH